MADANTAETIRADASTRNEAFQLLSDETRLEILQALAESDDEDASSPMGFAAIRERITADDPGRINYHLNKLSSHFIRRTDDGYELRESGTRVVRMLRAGTAVDDPEIEPVPVDHSCWFCGAQTTLSYRDGWRYLECTGCDARCVDTFPPGVLSKTELPPSGLLGRTPSEITDADRIWVGHRRASVLDGVCPECAGSMPVTSIVICDDHQPDWDTYQYCEHCGSLFWMLVSHVCEVCHYDWKLPTLFYPARHPAVVAFYYEHGIEFDLATRDQRSLLLDWEQELLSDDPVRIRITISLDDDELQLTYDDSMNVVDCSR